MLSQEKTTNGYASNKSTFLVVKDNEGLVSLKPEFYSEAAGAIGELHSVVQPYIDQCVPFITEWFAGYLHSKKFAELSEDKKDQTLWMYERTKEMWSDVDKAACNTNYGYYEPIPNNFKSI